MGNPTFYNVMQGQVTPKRLINFIRKKINKQGRPSVTMGDAGLVGAYYGDNDCRCPIGFLLSKKTLYDLVEDDNTAAVHDLIESYYTIMGTIPLESLEIITLLVQLQEAHDKHSRISNYDEFLKKFNSDLDWLGYVYIR